MYILFNQSPGLVSQSGFCPLFKPQDTPGPIARTVTDCALMLDCMVGFGPDDEWIAVAVTAPKPKGGSYAAELDPNAICKSNIGVIRSLFGSDLDPASNAVNKLVNEAMLKLPKTGTILVDVDVELPRLKHYMTTTPAHVVRSHSDINAVLSTKPHLPQDVADIVPENPPHPLDFTTQVTHGPVDPRTDPFYLQRLLDRDEFQRCLPCLMATHGIDALAFPDVQIPPPRHEDSTNGRFPTCWGFPTNKLLVSQATVPAIRCSRGVH